MIRGETASSRSKMIASAGMPFAFSSARSLAAGMYRTERRGRSEVMKCSFLEAVPGGQLGVARGELTGEFDHDLALFD